MKSNYQKFLITLFILLGVCIISSNLKAQEAATTTMTTVTTNEQVVPADPKMAEMMAKFQKYSTPTENHKALDFMAGSWTHSMKWWMSANTPPEESTGTSEVSWIMGGRFLQHNVNGTSMGQPFQGLGLTGYNNLKATYETIWIDNMGTGMMKGIGNFNPETKTMSEEGSFSCPMVDGDRTYRAVTTVKNNDHFTYEWYMQDLESGNEFKAMEITYSRKQ